MNDLMELKVEDLQQTWKQESRREQLELTFVTNLGDVIASHYDYVDAMMQERSMTTGLDMIAFFTRRELMQVEGRWISCF